MIKVGVAGCKGRMGSAVVNAVGKEDDMEVACGIDLDADDVPGYGFPVFSSIEEAVANADMDVLVDFTRPDAVAGNLRVALPAGIDCVVGTTGLSNADLDELAELCAPGTSLFYAPNFTIGAVLMMEFAKKCAPYFPEAEVIEYHHCNKLDAPSGTAVQTAELIAEARGDVASTAPGKETEMDGFAGARGADHCGVPIHSVRSMGFVANQDAIFGGMGQTLTISHASWDRESYMPGVILAIRKSESMSGLTIGLDKLLDL